MPAAGSRRGSDALKSVLGTLWISVGVCSLRVSAQEGTGCGHSVLGAESGTLASPNYPGTYPADTWCRWTLRVPRGRTLRLLFGDFDVESSPGCGNGSLVVDGGGARLGPLCGTLDASQKNLTLNTSQATVTFRSGRHLSGRGFLLSYATDRHPELISCQQRGSHFSSQHFSVYCPAGCKNVSGDVWGNSTQGYRDTSVLCKTAVHAGAVSDHLGGVVTVACGRSLTRYESTFSNGILSKMGSLSGRKLLFSRGCDSNVAASILNASSFWQKDQGGRGSGAYWSPAASRAALWAADANDPGPWVELELVERSNVTGIITTGSFDFYVESYVLLLSKDGKNWRFYKGVFSKEKMVFQAHRDGHVTVLNSLFPPAVARFVRLQPLTWQGRASARVEVLGCPVARVTRRFHHATTVNASTTQASSAPTEGPVLVNDISSSQPVTLVVGVVLGLVTCVGCLLVGVWWKRRKKAAQMKNCSVAKVGCQRFEGKSLVCTQSDLISYPLERSVHDSLPTPPLYVYAEPGMAAGGQKMGSTFRPSVDEGYTTPLSLTHYNAPGNLPAYAEPVQPESEYATPFGDQLPESGHGGRRCGAPTPAPCSPASEPAQYDCPAHRVLSNGYCMLSHHATEPRPASVIYAEPQSADTLLQHHMYEELL